MNDIITDLTSSATAGLIARSICHPIDTIKSKLQSGKDEYKSFSKTILLTLRRDGIRGFYGGIGAVLVGGIPGVSIYLTTYEQTKGYLTHNLNIPSPIASFASGLVAETVSCLVFVPVDVVKERLQVQRTSSLQQKSSPSSSSLSHSTTTSTNASGSRISTPSSSTSSSSASLSSHIHLYPTNPMTTTTTTTTTTASTSTHHIHVYPPHTQYHQSNIHYINSWDAIQKILKYEGIQGIYRGYGATLLSYGPFSALYFTFYELQKSYIEKTLQDRHIRIKMNKMNEFELTFTESLICAASAGAIASFLTSPLDMAKLRMQIIPSNQVRRNMSYYLLEIYKIEGIYGLFRGAGARILFHTPSTALTMACYEECKAFLNYMHIFN